MPSGRLRYMEIALPNILDQQGLIDEHHFWVNTCNADDLAWIRARCDEHPDFLKSIECPVTPAGIPTICLFYQLERYRNLDAIIIKMDDDLCYLAPNAIWNLLSFRMENPEYFLVFANTINNSSCDIMRQRAGLIKEFPFWATIGCGDPIYTSGEFALASHRTFLEQLKDGDLKLIESQFERFHFRPGERGSINCVCYFSEDIELVEWTSSDDEHLMTVETTLSSGRINAVCGSAVVAHFAFGPQRELVEAAGLLECYRRVSRCLDPKLNQKDGDGDCE